MSEQLNPGHLAGQSQALRDVLAHCEYLVTKGYAPASQINNWKVALRNVFETVDGEGYESVDLGSLDLEEYLGRFQTLALSGQKYKAESITTYKNRVRKAVEAYRYFLENGK